MARMNGMEWIWSQQLVENAIDRLVKIKENQWTKNRDRTNYFMVNAWMNAW